MQIFKYQLEMEDVVWIDMPAEAEILTMQTQYDIPCIWALVDPDRPIRPRKFRILGTGHVVPQTEPLKYIGTFQLLNGQFIGHVFEEI